jgi:hypothetical protein
MKIPTFLLLSLLLTACGRQVRSQDLSGDAKLQEKIVGTWRSEHGVVIFGPDGRSSSSFTNGAKAWTYQENWVVKDGFILGTVADVSFQNTTNHEPVGHTTRYKVLLVDDHHLQYVIELKDVAGGITNSLSR